MRYLPILALLFILASCSHADEEPALTTVGIHVVADTTYQGDTIIYYSRQK